MTRTTIPPHSIVLAWALAAGLAIVPLAADDRDLLRDTAASPMVFILFDTSTSMHWSPQCTQEQFDAGICDFPCETGDCYVPLNSDGSESKFFQAKAALYEVLQQVDNVNFGFATFNQDDLRVHNKHWLYVASSTKPDGSPNDFVTLRSSVTFPAIGAEDVFGAEWDCDDGRDFEEAGCHGSSGKIADMNDPAELRRAQRLAKLDRKMDDDTTIYLRDNVDGNRYKFKYRPVATLPDGTPNAYGNAKFAAEIEVRICTNDKDACASDPVDRQIVYYDLVDAFIASEDEPKRDFPKNGFFFYSTSSDVRVTGDCDGIDFNDDSNDDDHDNYNLRWPTTPDPPPPRFDTDGDGVKDLEDFTFGDLIPFDWEADHKQDILWRLAPNTAIDPTADPEFRTHVYFEDTRDSGDDHLRLVDERARPIMAAGRTPLGDAIKDFRTYYSGCPSGSCPKNSGIEDLGQFFDPDFNCRKKFLIVLTDGVPSCGGPDPCSGTAGLRAQTGIRTFVVAFGVQGGGTRLTCMAANGGTGDPIFPANKSELVDALLRIFGEVAEETRAFAAASVPTVQNETSDKVFLSNFTPIKDTSIWPGRLDTFRKPIPLDTDDRPDFTRSCQRLNLNAACHRWNAGDELCQQAPHPDPDTDPATPCPHSQTADLSSPLDITKLNMGKTVNTRRVFYGQENLAGAVPTSLRLFIPPTDDAEARDLWRGLGIPFDPTASFNAAANVAAFDKSEDILRGLLGVKTAIIVDPDGGPDERLDYVLGDIFHADPKVVSSPGNQIFFRADLHGYQDYSRKHFWRRKMLVVGANDGQLHFFDGGVRTTVRDNTLNQDVARFGDGTGRELFSYMPRNVLPIVRDQALGMDHIYSMDGNLTIGDAHIDPRHSGTDNRAQDRAWRTVLVGGMREAGNILNTSLPVPDFVSGYYALDVTQPDKLETPPVDALDQRPFPVPEGAVIPSCLDFDTTDGSQRAVNECPTPAGTANVFPAELWTFTDRAPAVLGGPFSLDEEDLDGDGDPDGNDEPDLGNTWSKPVIGRIQICAGASCDPAALGNNVEERYVAIFGGGLNSRNALSGERGSWLYMVDIETGRAIYKRQLSGATPAGPAAIDRDRDGFLDVIYIGTTLGFIYKVDLTARGAGGVPDLETVRIDNNRLVGDPLAAGQGANVERIIDPAWDPFVIFTTEGRPIFQTITTFRVPQLEQFGLAVGTGNRFNLWDSDGESARFYVIMDEDYAATDLDLPRRELNYASIAFDEPNTTVNFILDRNPRERGWVIRLGPDEKVINQAVMLVGTLIFSSFSPEETPVDADGTSVACARSGVSRIFVVNAENANAITDLDVLTDTDKERFLTIDDFTTAPYVDSSATKNPDDGSGATTESRFSDEQLALQEAIRKSLMRFFPEGCQYNKSYSLTVNASRSDTGFIRYATIPIAMCPVDWKNVR